jgi:hypothetical protein
MEKVLGKSVKGIFIDEIQNGTAIEFLKNLISDTQVKYDKNPKSTFQKNINVKAFNDMIMNSFSFFFSFLFYFYFYFYFYLFFYFYFFLFLFLFFFIFLFLFLFFFIFIF